MNYFAVFFGCGIGGLARYSLSRFASECIPAAIPPGTLTVNLIGSLLIGFFFALFNDSLAPVPLRLLVTTGFLGGFTTFSAYALETLILFQKREIRAGLINAFAHNLLGLAAVMAGLFAYAALKAYSRGQARM